MTTRTRAIILILAISVVAITLCACDDWDIDRTGFEATATASVRTEMARRAAETPAPQVAERTE